MSCPADRGALLQMRGFCKHDMSLTAMCAAHACRPSAPPPAGQLRSSEPLQASFLHDAIASLHVILAISFKGHFSFQGPSARRQRDRATPSPRWFSSRAMVPSSPISAAGHAAVMLVPAVLPARRSLVAAHFFFFFPATEFFCPGQAAGQLQAVRQRLFFFRRSLLHLSAADEASLLSSAGSSRH